MILFSHGVHALDIGGFVSSLPDEALAANISHQKIEEFGLRHNTTSPSRSLHACYLIYIPGVKEI